jgi:hypothetical protein
MAQESSRPSVADQLRCRMEELARDLAEAEERVSRLVIVREEVTQVLGEPAGHGRSEFCAMHAIMPRPTPRPNHVAVTTLTIFPGTMTMRSTPASATWRA